MLWASCDHWMILSNAVQRMLYWTKHDIPYCKQKKEVCDITEFDSLQPINNLGTLDQDRRVWKVAIHQPNHSAGGTRASV